MERCDCSLTSGYCRGVRGQLPANQVCVEKKTITRLEPEETIPRSVFDPKKPVVAILDDGSQRAARIICTDAKGLYPIIALTDWGPEVDVRSQEHSLMFDAQGHHVGRAGGGLKLVNVKVKKWKWVFKQGDGVGITDIPYSEAQMHTFQGFSNVIGRILETEIEE